MSKDIHVIPFNQLPATDRVTIAQQANWRVDGNGDWNQVVDKRYGSVHHVAIVDADGVVKFDKISIAWSPGVFVVPYRYNESEGKGHHEFLVPTERRILLYDANGQQGNVFVDNIPQGLINVDKEETPEEAAVRETKEETGFVPTQLIFLGNIGFDIANSSSLMPFFLAHVPFAQEAAKQELDETESIHNTGNWRSLAQLKKSKLIDGKTIIGLSLAEDVLRRALALDDLQPPY